MKLSSPRQTAARLALIYLVFCVIYVVVSTIAVRRVSHDVEQMQSLELFKGIAFMAITASLFYTFSRRALQDVHDHQRKVLDSQAALILAERRAVAGTFASSVAHDMCNILTIAGAELDDLSAGTKTPLGKEHSSDQLAKALEEMKALARRLVLASREGAIDDAVNTNILSVAHDAVEFAKTHTSVKGCQIDVSGDSSLTIPGCPDQLGVLVLNLVLNAAEATNGSGRIRIDIKRSPDGAAVLECHDNGPGMPPPVLRNLFTPFNTTKPNGTGLGLLSIRAVAQRHGGDVEYRRSPLGGACFSVRLAGAPLRQASPTP